MLDAREIKSVDEITLLSQAAAMVDGVYQDIVDFLKPGIRENQIVALANKRLYEMGSDQVEAVNAISGERCNPHPHNFTDRLIRPGAAIAGRLADLAGEHDVAVGVLDVDHALGAGAHNAEARAYVGLPAEPRRQRVSRGGPRRRVRLAAASHRCASTSTSSRSTRRREASGGASPRQVQDEFVARMQAAGIATCPSRSSWNPHPGTAADARVAVTDVSDIVRRCHGRGPGRTAAATPATRRRRRSRGRRQRCAPSR
jgi:hypothetical protein